MKKCKSCQKKIDLKAKKCPHCQTDQRNWFMRHKIITGIVVFIFLSIVVSAAGSPSAPDSTSGSTSEEAVTYQITQPIQAGDLEIVLESVEERQQVGGQYFNEKASEGATLVAINWTYKNIGDEPIGSFSQPSLKLVDSNDVEYEQDYGKSGTYATELELDRKILSDLNPGITVKDATVFEVSKEAYAEGNWLVRLIVNGKSYYVEL